MATNLFPLVDKPAKFSFLSQRIPSSIDEIDIKHSFDIISPHIRITHLDSALDLNSDRIGGLALLFGFDTKFQDLFDISVAHRHLPVLGDLRDLLKNDFEERRMDVSSAEDDHFVSPANDFRNALTWPATSTALMELSERYLWFDSG